MSTRVDCVPLMVSRWEIKYVLSHQDSGCWIALKVLTRWWAAEHKEWRCFGQTLSGNTCEGLEFEMLKLPVSLSDWIRFFSPLFLYFLIQMAKPQLICCQGLVIVLSARLRKLSFWRDVFLSSFHRAVNSHASRKRQWAAEIWSMFNAFNGHWCIVLIKFN